CPVPSIPNTKASCSLGVCGFACVAPYADCNGNAADGCETNTSTDSNNCGGCSVHCRPADGGYDHGQHCSGGLCCEYGFDNCGSGCVSLQSDPNHCGGCNSPCPAGWTCC